MSVPSGYQSFSTLNPEQSRIFSMIADMLGGGGGADYFKNIFSNDPQAFADFEKPAMRQFKEQIIPSISEGFSGVGAGRSSGFEQTLARAGTDLSERLASQRANIRSNSFNNLIQSALGAQTQVFGPQQKSGWQEALVGAAPGIASSGISGILALLGKWLFPDNNTSGGGFQSNSSNPNFREQQGSYINPATGQITGPYFGGR